MHKICLFYCVEITDSVPDSMRSNIFSTICISGGNVVIEKVESPKIDIFPKPKFLEIHHAGFAW